MNNCAYGGILQMFVVDICDSYTLGLPLQILPLLAADFLLEAYYSNIV